MQRYSFLSFSDKKVLSIMFFLNFTLIVNSFFYDCFLVVSLLPLVSHNKNASVAF